MKNFSSLVVLLALVGASFTASAQVKVPARGAASADNSALPMQAQPAATPSAAPAAATTQEADEDQPNIVLFTGTVKQEKLKALPGATVYVKSTRQMAVADENGDFSLELDFTRGPIELEVSYAGFLDQAVTITDPNTFLVVSMLDKKKK
jgi:CarboxypepD_reg-like domain